jgi:hypothetical protein
MFSLLAFTGCDSTVEATATVYNTSASVAASPSPTPSISPCPIVFSRVVHPSSYCGVSSLWNCMENCSTYFSLSFAACSGSSDWDELEVVSASEINMGGRQSEWEIGVIYDSDLTASYSPFPTATTVISSYSTGVYVQEIHSISVSCGTMTFDGATFVYSGS